MNLTISGHHLEVTPALRNYVETKLDRITRYFDQVMDVKVLLTVEKLKDKAVKGILFAFNMRATIWPTSRSTNWSTSSPAK